MCGICGIYSNQGVAQDELTAMTRTLAHRGPDDEGFHVGGPIGLGCRRLSVIDIETGRQPMSNEDGSLWIVFNGEIYNYRELRKDLEQKGHEFATRSDTEVIVHLYEEEGKHCVEKLQGMFALAIWDRRQEKLFLARDPLGQKPLFYARSGDRFVFASEIKSILAAHNINRRLDSIALHHYLSLRFIPSPQTMFEGIWKLPPGHRMELQGGQIRTERYWQLDFRDKLTLPPEELLEVLLERLQRTVSSHLVSDVPVGALLSGGMDSSMIVALMAELNPNPFHTFSIGVHEQSFDELPFARMVATHCGTQLVEESVKSDLIERLPQMTVSLDEPSDPTAACIFHAANLASRHVKVALGGDGGDELFAGFDRYLGSEFFELHPTISLILGRMLLPAVLPLTKVNFAYKSWTQKAHWLQRLAAEDDAGRRYAEATLFFRFSHEQKKGLLADSMWRQVKDTDSALVIAEPYDKSPALDTIDRMLYADYVTRLPEHSLMLGDRMSMAQGLEVRSPFVDHNLVSFLAKFPSRIKVQNNQLKHLLRLLARDYLPREITTRKKQGFMFPLAYWFDNELHPFLRRYLGQAKTVADGIFEQSAITRLLDDHKAHRIDNHVRIWMVLSFEIWYRLYLEGSPVDRVREELHDYLETTGTSS